MSPVSDHGQDFSGLSRPRVLVIESAGNLWGSERALLDLIDGIQAFEVAVCCPGGRPLVGELKRRGIQVLPYFVYAIHLKGIVAKGLTMLGVALAALRFRTDVIYLNQSGSYRTALLASALLRAPIVAHVRIYEDAVYLARQRPSSARLKSIVAISSSIEEAVRVEPALCGINVHRIFDAYAPSQVPNPPVGAHRVACVGRLVAIKGQDVLVGALGLMADPPECLMVGDGDPEFVGRVKALTSPRATVQWCGFIDDVMPLLKTCSVLACPSNREPLGRVIFEAWDAGCVPVAFAGCGGAAEIIRAANGGVLYDEQTPQSLAAALERTMALPEKEKAQLVSNGRSWTKANVDPRAYAASLEALFQAACA